MKLLANILLVCFVVLLSVFGFCPAGALEKNYYKDSCAQAEDIVRTITWKRTSANPILAPKFLRMHFHDCFVRGCDGSILLDSTANNTAEKAAIPNQSLSGFEVIDEIKTELEKKCRGTVSCADILALAARDAVSFQFQKPMWEVFTGRRDGKISSASEALANLPPPSSDFANLTKSFSSKGLNVQDLVALSGGHTIGVGHCNFFSNRLYNFTGKGDQDPSLDSAYAKILKSKCRNLSDNTTTVDMDPGSAKKVDSNFFVILKKNMGMFQSDAALLTNDRAKKLVDQFVNEAFFFEKFALSMKRMGAIGVLTGKSGEIRKNCRVIGS